MMGKLGRLDAQIQKKRPPRRRPRTCVNIFLLRIIHRKSQNTVSSIPHMCGKQPPYFIPRTEVGFSRVFPFRASKISRYLLNMVRHIGRKASQFVGKSAFNAAKSDKLSFFPIQTGKPAYAFLGPPKTPNCQRAGKGIFPFPTSDNCSLSEIGLIKQFIIILPPILPPLSCQ